MLLVETYVDNSEISGIGLFASQPIPKGTYVWRFAEGFDVTFTDDQKLALPRYAERTVQRYAYLSKMTGRWIMCLDNARFMNHSANPNLLSVTLEGEVESVDIAKTDIRAGEELTCNYFSIDSEFAGY